MSEISETFEAVVQLSQIRNSVIPRSVLLMSGWRLIRVAF
jgi:hypothetical protein